MSVFAKVLIGVGIGIAATVVTINVVSKIQEKTHKDDPTYMTIKEKATEKALEITTKILSFVSNHLEEIQAATSIVAFALPVLELVLDIRQFRVQDRLESKMDALSREVRNSVPPVKSVNDTISGIKDYVDVFDDNGSHITSYRLIPNNMEAVKV